MAKQAKPTGPPGYALATGVPGRAVLHNWPPEAIEALQELAKRFGIPQMGYHLTTPKLEK